VTLFITESFILTAIQHYSRHVTHVKTLTRTFWTSHVFSHSTFVTSDIKAYIKAFVETFESFTRFLTQTTKNLIWNLLLLFSLSSFQKSKHDTDQSKLCNHAVSSEAIFDIFEVLRSVLFLTQYVEAPLTLWILRFLDSSWFGIEGHYPKKGIFRESEWA